MKELKSNPIIDALERYETAVPILGFVGKNDGGKVKLYTRLDLATYLEIDAKDVIHVVEAEHDGQPARLFIRDSAEVKVVATTKASTLRKSRASSVLDRCDDESYNFFIYCLDLGFPIDYCVEGSRLVERNCRGEFDRRARLPGRATLE